ncbi:MAG: T9SS type A sorting domain-containing protein [Lentimicrobium sp.]|nr:T9SS type A sorting domain-containing protein [Lentimicrobium sp.]
MIKHLLSALFLAFFFQVQAQDTLVVMHYNLLNYGNYTSYCTSSNNNHEQKDILIKTIADHVSPHIFTVNEISQYDFYHNRILTNVLNTDGKNYFRRAEVTNIAGSSIINGFFYDSRKLVFHSQRVAQSYIRDINVYTLYYNHESLNQGDTIYIHCIVAHLKASSGSSNEQARSAMTNNTMNWLKNNMVPGNFLMMGDFNLYTSNEPGYQNLINPLPATQAFRFYDPVNKPGNWNNNSSFANWHTQSVSASGSGCQASGGMDDRFDFILASEKIIQGSANVQYINDSYHALGQDGMHFNTSINVSPQNTSVPGNVLEALATNSDHLPVVLKLKITTGPTGLRNNFSEIISATVMYSGDERYLNINSLKEQIVRIRIFDLAGSVIISQEVYLSQGNNTIQIASENLAKGMYLLNLSDQNNSSLTLKMVR